MNNYNDALLPYIIDSIFFLLPIVSYLLRYTKKNQMNCAISNPKPKPQSHLSIMRNWSLLHPLAAVVAVPQPLVVQQVSS
jgi:hypothetical protein